MYKTPPFVAGFFHLAHSRDPYIYKSMQQNSDGKAELPLRPCVGIVLFNPKGLVFVGERFDHPGAWQLPQGGIDGDETVEQAAMRELLEETGTDKAEIVYVSDVVRSYELPDYLVGKMWNGKFRGQAQRWVAMRFTGKDEDVTLYHGVHPEFTAWQWVPLRKICDLIVPFKRHTYEGVIEEMEPVIERSL